MIKNKMIAISLSIFLLLTMNSCGAGSVSNDVTDIENSPMNDEELIISSYENDEKESESEKEPILNNKPSYKNGDMHIDELNMQIKKLQVELDHYKSNLRELSAKSQVWGNPFKVYNKEIILTNGTTVFGKIVYQDRDVVKVETLIGKLIIDRGDIVRVVENIIEEDGKEEAQMSISPDQIEIIEVQNDDDESGINIIERRKQNQMASLVLIGDIQENKDKAGNTILNGEIKNIGTQRADFAKINITFRKNWHGDVETLTAFARGSYYTFKTGVSSDSSILPGAIAEFELIVPKSLGAFIGYSYTVDWEQYE